MLAGCLWGSRSALVAQAPPPRNIALGSPEAFQEICQPQQFSNTGSLSDFSHLNFLPQQRQDRQGFFYPLHKRPRQSK